MLGLTQEALAVLVRVSARTIGNWERGDTPPSRNVARLHSVLGLSGNDSNEPTLRSASDAQLVAEIAYRLQRAHAPAGQ